MTTKRTLTILLTLCSAAMILDMFDASHALALFLLAGIIPGTNIALDAGTMLVVFSGFAGFTLSRVFISLTAHAIHKIHLTRTHIRTQRA